MKTSRSRDTVRDFFVVAGTAILVVAMSQLPVSAYGASPKDPVVSTPFGLTHADCVHGVPSGSSVDRDGTVHEPNGATVVFPACHDPIAPANGNYPSQCPASGWVEYAQSSNNTSPTLGFFQANWTVPSAPTNNNHQVIYMFNGLQNTCGISNSAILQPVLSWGKNCCYGGQYWSIASWFFETASNFIHSSAITVSVGDHITGEIDSSNCSGGSCNWLVFASDTSSSSTTSVSCGGSSKLCGLTERLAFVTLESNATACNQFPASSPTDFDYSLKTTSGGSITSGWNGYINVTGCGESVTTTTTYVGLAY